MSKIPLKKLADLCHRVGTAYHAGVDVQTIWKREANNGSPHNRAALQKVARQIGEGQTVAEGMTATEGYFPELAIAITKAGEEGGRLERAFQLLSKHYDALVRFRRDMAGRLVWPLLELAGAVVIIGLLIIFMGWATSTSGGEPIDWLGFGWTTNQYFWAYVVLITTVVATFSALIFGSSAGWFGDFPMRLSRHIPLLGKTIQIFSLARFAWVLAAVYEAGMNTMDGVALAFRSTQNYYYQQFEENVTQEIQNGTELTQSLRDTDAFPEDFLMHVENGELTGNIPESMNRLAKQYTDEAEANLGILSKVLFMIIFSMVALIIATLIIMLYMRYMNTIRSFAS